MKNRVALVTTAILTALLSVRPALAHEGHSSGSGFGHSLDHVLIYAVPFLLLAVAGVFVMLYLRKAER